MQRYLNIDHTAGDITIATYDTVEDTIDGTVRITVHLRGKYEYEQKTSHRDPYYDPPTVLVEYDERISFDVEFERFGVGAQGVIAPVVIRFKPVSSLDSFIDACSNSQDFPEDESSHNPMQIAIDLKTRVSRQPATSHTVNTSGSFDIWLENILEAGDASYGVRDLKLRIAKHCDRFIRATLPRYMK